MPIQKVVLIGANGHLGPSILKALLDDSSFQVSVISRASSKSTYDSQVTILSVDDSLPHEQLVKALTGQDALIMAFSGTMKDNSIKLADAAFEAGVKHIIPADFGSCDSSDSRSLDLVPLYVNKKVVRDHLQKLIGKQRDDGSSVTWTSLITGHFFDYGLKSGLLAINLEEKTARVFDDGNAKFAATTLATIGYATAQVLKNIDDSRIKNKLIYVQGVQTTQNDLIKAVEEATGNKLQVEHVSSDEYKKHEKAKLDADPGNAEIIEELVTVEGLVNTNWDTKGDAYVNDLLNVPMEDVRVLVKKALE